MVWVGNVQKGVNAGRAKISARPARTISWRPVRAGFEPFRGPAFINNYREPGIRFSAASR
jgi:hypothetical protein